jgi:hypothetical protein
MLLNSISTSASRNGDPFIAVVAEPVYLGDQLLIPAGARINGIVSTVARARHFSLIRGEAYMDLTFRSLEIDSRLIPVQMSIITIEKPGDAARARPRKDMNIEEGGVVQEKHDYKGDVLAATLGTGGASLIGAMASYVVRGLGIGLAGSAVYVVSRKGKEVVIPAHSGIVARMDNTISVPATAPPLPAAIDAFLTKTMRRLQLRNWQQTAHFILGSASRKQSCSFRFRIPATFWGS